MQFDFLGDKPIFLQVSDAIEDAIFVGAFKEEEQVPSTTDISSRYKINPATVLKGMNLLVEQDIIYKRRGLGMFVKEGAVEKIHIKRKALFYDVYVKTMLQEAKKLGLSRSDLLALIDEGGYDQ